MNISGNRSVVFILIVLYCIVCYGQAPGAKGIVTPRGMNYFRDVATNFIRREIRNVPIPDQRGSVPIPFGPLNWQVTTFRMLDDVRFGEPNIRTSGDVIVLHITGGWMRVSFLWRWAFGLISDQGSGEAILSNTVITAQVAIHRQGDGKLGVNVRSLTLGIGNLDLKITGNMPKPIVDVFLLLFRGVIRKMIEDQASKVIASEITRRMNQELAKIPTFIDFHQGVALDYGFVRDPRFLPDNMVTGDLRGEFFDRHNRKPSDFAQTNLPSFLNSDKMIQLIFSEFTFLTAAETLHRKKLLDVIIVDSMLPQGSPIRLHSSDPGLQTFLPGLHQTFPNEEIRLKLFTERNPHVVIHPENATINAFGAMQFIAIERGTGNPRLAFTLSGVVILQSRVRLVSRFIVPELLFMTQSSTVRETHIGPVNVAALNILFNMLFERGLVPHINQYLKENPIALPTLMDFELLSPDIHWDNHFLRVLTDVRYVGKSLNSTLVK